MQGRALHSGARPLFGRCQHRRQPAPTTAPHLCPKGQPEHALRRALPRLHLNQKVALKAAQHEDAQAEEVGGGLRWQEGEGEGEGCEGGARVQGPRLGLGRGGGCAEATGSAGHAEARRAELQGPVRRSTWRVTWSPHVSCRTMAVQ